MTATVQPALDGSIPPPKVPAARRRAADYETWVDEVRPKLLAKIAEGRSFTFYQLADELDLPDPPDPAHQWGRLARQFRDDGLTYHYGWDNSARPASNHSGVKVWRGPRAARNGRAA